MYRPRLTIYTKLPPRTFHPILRSISSFDIWIPWSAPIQGRMIYSYERRIDYKNNHYEKAWMYHFNKWRNWRLR